MKQPMVNFLMMMITPTNNRICLVTRGHTYWVTIPLREAVGKQTMKDEGKEPATEDQSYGIAKAGDYLLQRGHRSHERWPF
jgi:hypothetical protein